MTKPPLGGETPLSTTTRILERVHSFTAFAAKLRVESGQALAEYALILTLIAMFAVVSLRAIGISVTEPLNDVATALGGA